jgi:hypothetical protein
VGRRRKVRKVTESVIDSVVRLVADSSGFITGVECLSYGKLGVLIEGSSYSCAIAVAVVSRRPHGK